jgi:signal transduction histidine kinase
MTRAPIRIRTFILGALLFLLLVPPLTGGAAWLIERDRQQAGIQHRVDTAVAYLTAHRSEMRARTSVQGFSRLLGRIDLLAQLVIATTTPPGKSQLYISPALSPAPGSAGKKELAREAKIRQSGATPATAPSGAGASWVDDHRVIPAAASGSRAILVADLFHRPSSSATRALVALVTGVLILLAGLAVAVWLAGRWMVAPLARLSAQVDKIAGGDLAIALPRSRIGEISNIAQAVEGMTAVLDENAQRRAEADEARRFLVTSIAHDLRTPLFALRGHLQAIGTRLGSPGIHLERAEARADALERLIGNLFAYTRDDYAQPAPQFEPVPVADLLHEVTTGLEHMARLGGNTFTLNGDPALRVIVDRDRSRRALTNILDNALRYSPLGDPIYLSWATRDSSTVEITVADQGPGVDPELLPHIFEPGIRGAPAATGSDHGAGLGLTIAKRLLEHQHATVAIHNGSTRGAAVTIRLQREPSPGNS